MEGETQFSVIWRGKKFVMKMNLNTSLKDLGDELQKQTNVKTDTMRLIVSSHKTSKILYPFTEEHSSLTLKEASILEGKSIRMMGVLPDEVDEVLQNSKIDLRVAGFDEEDERMRKRMSKGQNRPQLPQGTYIFCDFRTLHIPGIELNPPASVALALMHKLAADPGIIAIMNKHRWRVGIMTEMAPIGYVGVSPKCILGFNKNQGEEISLRLRTDDLKGFRKYQSIKKTLLHELAHMVHSEHDTNFFALNKQLNEEAEGLDWTKSTSQTLSGVKSNEEEEFYIDESVSVSRKLGGETPVFFNARESSVSAAFHRLANLSVDFPETSMDKDTPDYDDVSEQEFNNTMNIENLENLNHEPEPESMESESHVESEIISEADINEIPEEVDMQNSQGIIAEDHIKLSVLDDEELKRIQDPVSILCNRLQKAIEILRSEVSPIEATRVLQTLLKIVGNVIEHPDEVKFKRLRKANNVIQRSIVKYKGAMEIMGLMGFMEEMIYDENGKSESYLIIKHNDTARLWLAKSSLESHIVM